MVSDGMYLQRIPLAVRNSSERWPRRDERSLWFYTKETIEFEVYVICKKTSMILILCKRWAGRICCLGLASGATSYTSFSKTQGVLFCYICILLIIIKKI